MISKVSKSLILFTCLSLCVLQMKDIFNEYFQYSVTTKVVIRYPTDDNPPAGTVCFESTLQKYPPVRMTLYDRLNVTPSVLEIFTSLILKVKPFKPINGSMTDLKALYNPEDYYSVRDIFEIDKFILAGFYGDGVCFKFSHKPNYTFDYSSGHADIYKINFKFDQLFKSEDSDRGFHSVEYKVAIHSSDSVFKPAIDRNNYYYKGNLQKSGGTIVKFIFGQYSIDYLEPPYKTSCLDYRKLGFADREERIQHCTLTDFMAKTDHCPSSILVSNQSADCDLSFTNKGRKVGEKMS